MLSVNITSPPTVKTPPPRAAYPDVLLPLNVLLVSVKSPRYVKTPPPLPKTPEVLLPLITLLLIESKPLDANRIPPPLSVVSGTPPIKALLDIIRPPVTVTPSKVRSPEALEKFNTRELSSNRSLNAPAVPPKLAPTLVTFNESVTSSLDASPVIVTPTPVVPSIVSSSVISNSVPFNRIRLDEPPVNTLASNVIVSTPLPVSPPGATNTSLLAASIASRRVTILSVKSTGRSAVLLTTNVASKFLASS